MDRLAFAGHLMPQDEMVLILLAAFLRRHLDLANARWHTNPLVEATGIPNAIYNPTDCAAALEPKQLLKPRSFGQRTGVVLSNDGWPAVTA